MGEAPRAPLEEKGNASTEFETHKVWSEPVEQGGYHCCEDSTRLPSG